MLPKVAVLWIVAQCAGVRAFSQPCLMPHSSLLQFGAGRRNHFCSPSGQPLDLFMSGKGAESGGGDTGTRRLPRIKPQKRQGSSAEHKKTNSKKLQGPDAISPQASKKAKEVKAGAESLGDGLGGGIDLPGNLDEQLFAAFGDKLSAPLEEWLKPEEGGSSKDPAGVGDEQAVSRTTAHRDEMAAPVGEPSPREGKGLSAKKLLEYERNGHAKVPRLLKEIGMDAGDVYDAFDNVFNARLLEAYTQKLRVFGVEEPFLAKLKDPDVARQVLEDICEEEEREVPFLQIFHLHEGTSKSAAKLRALALSPRLGQLAADLMGVKSVMLYQTCAFVKEPGNGETRWHSDLNTAPFDTNDMLTFWIALTPVPTVDHAPLEFATGSHRDFALPYWYTNDGMKNLDARDYKIKAHQPLVPGDATVHHGWVLHAAPPNMSDQRRCAFAVTYVSAHAKTLPKGGLRRQPDDEDLEGYRSWLALVKPGAPARNPSLPVVWPQTPAAN